MMNSIRHGQNGTTCSRQNTKYGNFSDTPENISGRNILGENIRRLRKEKNINQKELASNLHTLRQTVSAYERGVTLPDVFMLIMIADFFGVSLDELTGRTELVIPEKEV